MDITTSWDRHPHQAGGDLVIRTRRRWLRLAAYYGEPPGSHTGYWRTRTGTVHGWNLRAGTARRALTVLLHTRRTGRPPA